MGEAFLVGGNTLANSNEILDLIGTTADTGGSATAGTLMAKMNNMLGNAGAVKSVQRGMVTITKNPSVSVSINSINIDKAILFIGVPFYSYNNEYKTTDSYIATGRLINSNTIAIYTDTDSSSTDKYAPWQVVEFY